MVFYFLNHNFLNCESFNVSYFQTSYLMVANFYFYFWHCYDIFLIHFYLFLCMKNVISSFQMFVMNSFFFFNSFKKLY